MTYLEFCLHGNVEGGGGSVIESVGGGGISGPLTRDRSDPIPDKFTSKM